jgi:hypothetical protein
VAEVKGFSRNAGAWALAAGAAMCGPVHAAGGHHGVDDAAILESGTCELEGWLARAGAAERLLHAGVGCRVGAVELGLAAERARDAEGHATGYGLQVKWATEWVAGLSAGVSVSPAWQAHGRPRYQGSTVSGLLTWAPREDVAVHANLGRDLLHGAPDLNRSGGAVEWTPKPGWSLMVERYAESATQWVRAGARWAAAENLTVDLSRAQRLRGPGASNWTLGASWLIDRR